jgi:8-hydroxy-5-deazaflavin:NADPH oxidoreductase
MNAMTTDRLTIAILGGAGKEGGGLAMRWANAGHRIIIGSRDAGRAAEAAGEINTALGRDVAQGMDNLAAAKAAELVVLAVPYSAQLATLEAVRAHLTGKILIDVTVPLVPPKVSQVQLPEGGSAVKLAQALLGEDVRVVSAFQNISAVHLKELDHVIESDVLVCSDDSAAADLVVDLAREIGLGAFNAGALANSAAAEAVTSILIAINRRYKVSDSGIRITGVPAA